MSEKIMSIEDRIMEIETLHLVLGVKLKELKTELAIAKRNKQAELPLDLTLDLNQSNENKTLTLSVVSPSDNIIDLDERKKAASSVIETLLRAKSNFIGHHSLFTKYLSSTVINSGKGFIKPTDKFAQYEEDALQAPIDKMIGWPSGFYRNIYTKETQLLISTTNSETGEIVVFCIDGLPGNDGYVFVASDYTVDKKHILQINDIDHLTALTNLLSRALDHINSEYEF